MSTSFPADLVVAAAQVEPVPGDVRANVEAFGSLIRDAARQDVDLIVFPELALIGYHLNLLGNPDAWVDAADPRLILLRDVCIESGITALVGAAYHDTEGLPRLAAIAFRPDGSTTTAFKIHLAGHESDHFVGAAYPPTVIDVNGWKVGIGICFDVANPSHAMAVAEVGADVYAAPAFYDLSEIRRLDLHFGSRAMDHRMYAVFANLAGSGTGIVSCGRSGTWGPDGEVRMSASLDVGLVIDRLSYAEIAAFRSDAVTATASMD